MRILFFDTETTGFPNNWPLDGQPNIVQIAWMFKEESESQTFDYLFKSLRPIPKQTSDIHWITDDMVADRPLLYKDKFIVDFMRMMKYADIIVGHNVDFDFKMIFIEIERTVLDAKDDQIIPEKMESMKLFERECRDKSVCTMQNSISLCKLPGKFWTHKLPKLQELHKHLYWEEFDSAHNALNDIRATERCFDTLVEKGIIKL